MSVKVFAQLKNKSTSVLRILAHGSPMTVTTLKSMLTFAKEQDAEYIQIHRENYEELLLDLQTRLKPEEQ